MFGCMTRQVLGTVARGAVAYAARERWLRRVPALRAPLGSTAAPAFVAVDGEAPAALAPADLRRRLPSGPGDVAVHVEGVRPGPGRFRARDLRVRDGRVILYRATP